MKTQSVSEELTQDQRRTLALGIAIADELVRDPDRVLEMARSNLVNLQAHQMRGQAKHVLHEWSVLLHGPVPAIVDVLKSPQPHARELRQNGPFAGVLGQHQRVAVLAKFREAENADTGPA